MRPATLELPSLGMPVERLLASDRDDQRARSHTTPTWRVRGFIFEASNVLFDDTSWRRWLFRLLSSMGLHTNYASFFRVWDDEYLPAVNRGDEAFAVAFRRFLSAVGLSAAQVEEVEYAAHPQREAHERNARTLPGVSPTLQRLAAAGARLGVLSDCTLSRSQLSTKITRLGLGEMIEHYQSSLELHATKPAATCYESMLDDLDLDAHSVAFVSHRHDDLAGAAACGLRTIAFNWDSDAEADWHLTSFPHLAAQFFDRRRAA